MGNQHDIIYKYIKLYHSKSNDNKYNIQNKLTEYIKKHPLSLYSNSKEGLTPYMFASSFNIDTLMMLHDIYENVIDFIPDVYIEPFNYKNKNGHNLIYFVVFCIIKGKQDIFMLEYIINNIGVDINSTDKYGNSVLHLATKYNKIDIVKVLLFYGIDVNIINKYKKTAMNYTVINKNMDIFKLLLYKKANYKYSKNEINYPLFHDIIDSYKKKLHKKLVGYSKKKSKNKSTDYFKKQHVKLCSVFIHKDNNDNENKNPIPEHYKKELRYLAKQLNINMEAHIVNKNDDEYDVYNNLCKLISHKILMKKSLKK